MGAGADTLSNIRGQIERITFSNEENGFTIAKLKSKGERDLVTVVGSLPERIQDRNESLEGLKEFHY